MTERRQMLIIILLVINAVLICCFGILVVKQLNEKYDMLSSHVISKIIHQFITWKTILQNV